MSKYDFPLDLSENTSTGKILHKIRQGSTVLEFGCAEGRMTRYMKEELHCRVYIVEYNRGAFEIARQYAEDGICDDILTYSWHKRFKDIRFDAVLFADVLEHLSTPAAVLNQAASLLGPSGRIYVSIPNITHNDILLKIYHDHWDYTSVGLLDNTHIFFWGYANLSQLARDAGIHLAEIDATYCPIGETEQKPDISDPEESILRNYLAERKCGEIYQFVLTFDCEKSDEPIDMLRSPGLLSHIYYDDGSGFTGNKVIPVPAVFTDRHTLRVHYEMTGRADIRSLRFDPVEGQPCLVESFSVEQGGQCCKVNFMTNLHHAGKVLLLGTDPQIIVELSRSTEPLVLQAEFSIPTANYLNEMAEWNQELENGLEQERRKTVEMQASAEKLKNQLLAAGEQICAAQQEISSLQAEQRNLEKISAARQEQYRRDLDLYARISAQKDEIILAKEKTIEEQALSIHGYEQSVQYYRNLPGVRAGIFAKKILRELRVIK